MNQLHYRAGNDLDVAAVIELYRAASLGFARHESAWWVRPGEPLK